MSLIEAALARVPIITTDVGIVGEVFAGIEDVLSAPPGDPAQLAIHMVTMIENNSARQVLARNAEQKAKAHLALHADLAGDVTRDLLRLSGGSSPA